MSKKPLLTNVRAGQRWQRFGRTARVLGVLEGYVVYRFKGAGVSTIFWKDFEKNFTLVPVRDEVAGKAST